MEEELGSNEGGEGPADTPPAPVPISPDERSEVTEHINRKAIAADDACSVCGSPQSIVVEHVYRADVMMTAPVVYGTHQPLYSTVCMDCGYVRFFNRNIVQGLIADFKASQDGGNDGR